MLLGPVRMLCLKLKCSSIAKTEVKIRVCCLPGVTVVLFSSVCCCCVSSLWWVTASSEGVSPASTKHWVPLSKASYRTVNVPVETRRNRYCGVGRLPSIFNLCPVIRSCLVGGLAMPKSEQMAAISNSNGSWSGVLNEKWLLVLANKNFLLLNVGGK